MRVTVIHAFVVSASISEVGFLNCVYGLLTASSSNSVQLNSVVLSVLVLHSPLLRPRVFHPVIHCPLTIPFIGT